MTADRIPFVLLGGYLGAGKTTVLNHLLANAGGRRLAVLVNDVGAVNVDAALVAEHDGDTLTLTNGCVCCGLEDDLALTLERVRSLDPAPDHVVMELSGVAQPARVVPWANTPGFELDGVVVVADADQLVELAARRYVGDTIDAQLAAADVVLLSKTDLATDGGSAARRLVTSRSRAPIIEATDGVVDVAVILGIDGPGAPVTDVPSDHHAASVIDVGQPTVAEVEALVDGFGDDVVRAKGLVSCADVDVPVEVQVVGRRRTVRIRDDLTPERTDQRLVLITA